MNAHRIPPQKPIIIIPSRMGSTRLPGKPLSDIHGLPMIVHVMRRAEESKVGPVIVACDDARIVDVVEKAGGKAILTKMDHASGSDRIWEALQLVDDGKRYDAVINVQGDEPALDPMLIRTAWSLLGEQNADVATLAAIIVDEGKKELSQVVKAVIDVPNGGDHGRGLYFSRLPVPGGQGPYYHHIGLYAYRRDALELFVRSSPSPVEKRESLEQLRALALGLHIEVGVVQATPRGVDTLDDLNDVRSAMGPT